MDEKKQSDKKQKNIGRIDKTIRIVLGSVIILYSLMINPWIAIIGIALITTAIIRICPLYWIFQVDTCPFDTKKKL